MKFEFEKTLELLLGGLTAPSATWESYLAEDRPWLYTLANLAAPLILLNAVLGLLLSRWFGTFSAYNIGGNWFVALVQGLAFAAIGFAIAVLIINFLASVFKGQSNFSRAFAAVSLVAIPAWVAGVVGAAIPWVGGLIAFAGAIVSLVFLYRILPLALAIPDDQRMVHFVVSIVVIVVINIIIGTVLGLSGATSPGSTYARSESSREAAKPASGMFGEIQRQAEMIAAAEEQDYDPPSDGEVTKSQARWVEEVLGKARAAASEEMAKLEQLQEEIDEDRDTSPADLAKMYQGMGSVMSLGNLEMEIVLSGDGNWAEYQWIKQQLRAARLQRGEGDAAVEHNYELFMDMDEDLRMRL